MWHFAVDCSAEVCDNCLKPKHKTDDCPLLAMPKPVVTTYGVCSTRLMFFETQSSNSSRPRLESAWTRIVRVSGGLLLVEQLSRLILENFCWSPNQIEDDVFKDDFLRKEDVARLMVFGIFKVPESPCSLQFDEWSSREPTGIPLHEIWVRFHGALSKPLNDFMEVWSFGSLISKTEKVDMPYTRKRGFTWLLVGVLTIDDVPEYVDWYYKSVGYELHLEIEGHPCPRDEMQDGDNEDDQLDKSDHRPDDAAGKNKGSDGDHSLGNGKGSATVIAPGKVSYAVPATLAVTKKAVSSLGLRFGSFAAASTPSRLWSDHVEGGDPAE